MDNRVLPRFRSRILPLDLPVLQEWGRRSGLLQEAGQPAAALEGLLAATAHIHQLRVVTRNQTDFEPWAADCHDPWDGPKGWAAAAPPREMGDGRLEMGAEGMRDER